ncbi:condensation domain-containing protein, partial [Rugosimonospora africana]|uniref:condensation domain-containing protein n=1 Tax=Rugosimonospora africana TaxID=556532 RepID=UPI001EF1D7D4
MTGLVLALGWWRRQWWPDAGSVVVLDLEGHGRDEGLAGGVLSGTVGWFTSMFPVRLDPGPVDWAEVEAAGPGLGLAVKRVKEQLRAVPDNGIGYGLLRYLNPDTGRELDTGRDPQVVFNYLGRVNAPRGQGWLIAEESEVLGQTSRRDLGAAHSLEVNAITHDLPDGPQLSVTWTWIDGVFTEPQINDLAHAWFQTLHALTEHAQHDNAGG